MLDHFSQTIFKKMKKKILFISCVMLLILNSCTNRILDFTLISSKNVDLSRGASFVRGNNRIEGQDKVHWIICFPTKQLDIKEAIDKAIESTPGCVALLDGVIYTNFWWIPYIYGQQTATIEGTPLIDTSLTLNSIEIPTYGQINLDKNGEIENVMCITATEYFMAREKIVKEARTVEFTNSKEIK
jgi:hypothetical protein